MWAMFSLYVLDLVASIRMIKKKSHRLAVVNLGTCPCETQHYAAAVRCRKHLTQRIARQSTHHFALCLLVALRQLGCVALASDLPTASQPTRFCNTLRSFSAVFLNRRAAARYRSLTSIIPGRETFSWNLSF